jgi:xanthine dehydrogenase YagR molybdenum-binding subunit
MTTAERSEHPTVGAPLVRADSLDKVTGCARYAYEYPVPDVAYVWPVGATIARGRVRKVDPSAALAVPGVLAVLDQDNTPRLRPGARSAFVSMEDLYVLQSPEVAYHGQVVAAVVALSLEAAREGAAAVRVTYERQPHDVVLRADHEAVRQPETMGVGLPAAVAFGDVERALADAPVCVEATYTTPAEHTSPLEPHATIASWDGDRLTLHNSDQAPHFSAQALAALFGLEESAVEIVSEYVGGGFGSKAMPRVPTVLAALAARAVGRPVKIALTRRQMVSLVPHRTPTIQRLRLGADRDGRLVAVDHDAVHQCSTLLEYTEATVASTPSLYAVPHVRATARVVALDVPPPSWFRAPGHAPGMFALESAMDELASALGIDPIELRIRNQPETDGARELVACLREGAARFGWDRRVPSPGAGREGRWLVGTGVAVSCHPYAELPSQARTRIEPDGTYRVEVGAADIGTGARTVLHQVAADALGTSLDRVRIGIGRASLGLAAAAGGSMGTASWGRAVHKACRALAAELFAHGGTVPDGGPEVLADTTEDLAGYTPGHTYGAQFARVRVDTDTGEIVLDRLLGVFAAGRILNPRTARSQFLGAMTMGVSMALLESGELDPGFGDFAEQDLAAYHFAANADIRDLEAVWLDEQDERPGRADPGERPGPTDIRGIGELGIVGTAAAIANAFHHATGVRVRDLPLRVERSRQALAAGLRGPGQPR